jgi:hypothetical protein
LNKIVSLLLVGVAAWIVTGCGPKATPLPPTPTPSTPVDRVKGYEAAVTQALWWMKIAANDLEKNWDDEVGAYLAGLGISTSFLSLTRIHPPSAEDTELLGTGIDYVAEYDWIVGGLLPCEDVGIIAFDMEGTTLSQLQEAFVLCKERLQIIEKQVPVFFKTPTPAPQP